MKANNGKGNITSRDEWQTPQDLWDKLNQQYNFKFDCCADQGNNKTTLYSSNFERTQKIDFIHICCWMNPPFSKSRVMFQHFFNTIKRGVAIFRCDNLDSKIWQEVIFPNASWIFVLLDRLNYTGFKGDRCRFGSALIGFNVDKPKGLRGITLKPLTG